MSPLTFGDLRQIAASILPLLTTMRMSASLIGRLGQVHFIVSFPFLGSGLSSGSRFSSQSLLVLFGWTAACMCRIGRRAPRFVSRSDRRSRHIRRHLQTSSGEGRSRQLSLGGCQVIAASKGL